MRPNLQEHLFDQALSAHKKGDIAAAQQRYLEILERYPKHAEALHHLGLVYLQKEAISDAILWINKSLKYEPRNATALSNLAYCLNLAGEYHRSIDACKSALSLNSRLDSAHINMGNAQRSLRLFDQAIRSYRTALEIEPSNPHYFYNLANCFFDQGRYREAAESFEITILKDPSIYEAHNNLAACLVKLRDFTSALNSLDIAIKLKPDYAEAWNNKSNVLLELRYFDEALSCIGRAIQIRPDYSEAWNSRGNLLCDLDRHEEALKSYKRALELKPSYAEAWRNLGNSLWNLKQYNQAIESYASAIKITPDLEFLAGTLLHAKTSVCDWSDLEQAIPNLEKDVKKLKRVTNPFELLSITDKPELHFLSAKVHTEYKFPDRQSRLFFKKKYGTEKIKLGYFSTDFRQHPVGYLIAGLFEEHDKDKFELHGFSFGHGRKDELTKRISASFHNFTDVEKMSDNAIAKLSRDIGIDIAIDLNGYTLGARLGVFAERCAPIQITYLGYPGTMGSTYFDYIVADKILVPESCKSLYSEKIVFLPNSYQINDQKRGISSKKISKQQAGLPENQFIFCCFNNSYKILPGMFDSWMRILNAVEGSVLWLLEDNPLAAENLRKEASRRNTDPARIVFAKRVPLDEHLARQKLADLFIDTFPYNAHTTASDALWSGLPVLTLKGESFASRVAASLLYAVGIPELVVTTQPEYEAKAKDLALDKKLLLDLKLKLDKNRLTSPLFDTKLFAKHIESGYLKMYNRFLSDLDPNHIEV